MHHRSPGRSLLRIAVLSLGVLGTAGAVVGACSSSDGTPAGEVDGGSDTAAAFDSSAGDSGADGSSTDIAADTRDSAVTDTTEAGCSPVDAGPTDDAAIARGLAFVEANKCKGCHTADLSGSTSPVMGAYPKNLTSDVTGLACEKDEDIIRAFTIGIDDDGSAFCVMPKFSSLDDAGAHDLVAFIRSLPPVKKVIPATVCPSPDGGTDGDTAGDGG